MEAARLGTGHMTVSRRCLGALTVHKQLFFFCAQPPRRELPRDIAISDFHFDWVVRVADIKVPGSLSFLSFALPHSTRTQTRSPSIAPSLHAHNTTARDSHRRQPPCSGSSPSIAPLWARFSITPCFQSPAILLSVPAILPLALSRFTLWPISRRLLGCQRFSSSMLPRFISSSTAFPAAALHLYPCRPRYSTSTPIYTTR